jgi:hypothetical protein
MIDIMIVAHNQKIKDFRDNANPDPQQLQSLSRGPLTFGQNGRDRMDGLLSVLLCLVFLSSGNSESEYGF